MRIRSKQAVALLATALLLLAIAIPLFVMPIPRGFLGAVGQAAVPSYVYEQNVLIENESSFTLWVGVKRDTLFFHGENRAVRDIGPTLSRRQPVLPGDTAWIAGNVSDVHGQTPNSTLKYELCASSIEPTGTQMASDEPSIECEEHVKIEIGAGNWVLGVSDENGTLHATLNRAARGQSEP